MSRITNRARKQIATLFSRKLAWRTSLSPIVTFTFDDFPRSAFVTAGHMLEEKGVHGTYYVAMGMMGTISGMGEMFSEDDLHSLVENGHELACHTYSHISCNEYQGSTLQNQCAKNRRAIVETLGGYQVRNFSFPFGDATLFAKATLLSTYDSCRSIERGINTNAVDLGFLRANPVYSSRPVEELKQMIEENEKRGGWLILYTHDVTLKPSRFGCTPSYLRAVIDCVLGSGAQVMTIGEAVGLYVYDSKERMQQDLTKRKRKHS